MVIVCYAYGTARLAGEADFLLSLPRLNVAFTRAKRLAVGLLSEDLLRSAQRGAPGTGAAGAAGTGAAASLPPPELAGGGAGDALEYLLRFHGHAGTERLLWEF